MRADKSRRYSDIKKLFYRESPLYAYALLDLKERFDSTFPTAYTDGEVVAVNPEFLDKLTLREGGTVLAHEVLHVLLKHPLREEKHQDLLVSTGRQRCHQCCCIAADLVVDQFLQADKKPPLPRVPGHLPDGALSDDRAKGASVAQILPWVYDEYHPHHPQPEGGGCCRGAGKLSDAELAELESKIDDTLLRAAQTAESRGLLPAWAEGLVEDMTLPKLRWEDHLRRWYDQVAATDYNFSRPSRPGLGIDTYLPSFEEPSLGEVAIMVDTSGSVDNPTLSVFAARCREIWSECRPDKVHVLYVDAAVAGYDCFEHWEDFEFRKNPPGRGGTSFRPGYRYLTEAGIQPRGVLYFTDLDGDWKEMDDPGIETIFIVPGEESEALMDKAGDWGTLIFMRGDPM